jgi:antitoxin (DNA-binding transcriptional repressor) of toxin-antitoxin stability system
MTYVDAGGEVVVVEEVTPVAMVVAGKSINPQS